MLANLLDHLAAAWQNRRYEQSAKRHAPELTELGLRRVQPTADGRGWEATFLTPTAAIICNEMAAVLDNARAENYVTYDFLPKLDRDARPVRVTIQWANGKNPGTLVTELKARIAELEGV